MIKTQEELNFLEKRLKNNDPMLIEKEIKYNLLYRASRDGDHAAKFHQLYKDKRGYMEKR